MGITRDQRQALEMLAASTNGYSVPMMLAQGCGIVALRRLVRDQLATITAILDRSEPHILVLQDTGPSGTRRAKRLVALNLAVEAEAHQRSIPVFKYSRAEVYECFAWVGFVNKQVVAELIAKHIPAFEQYVLPPRKPWKSEDARMGIFDAAALALTFSQKAGEQQGLKNLVTAS